MRNARATAPAAGRHTVELQGLSGLPGRTRALPGVAQVYDSGHPSAGRDAIASLCVQANTPVARCSTF